MDHGVTREIAIMDGNFSTPSFDEPHIILLLSTYRRWNIRQGTEISFTYTKTYIVEGIVVSIVEPP